MLYFLLNMLRPFASLFKAIEYSGKDQSSNLGPRSQKHSWARIITARQYINKLSNLSFT